MRNKLILFLMLALFGSASFLRASAEQGNVRADQVIEQGFEDGLGDWTMNHCHSSSGPTSSYGGNTGSYAFRFYYTANYPQYLISPELDDNDGVNFTFYAARYSSNYPETFKVGYSSTTNDPTEFTWDSEVTCTTMYGAGAYEEYSYDFPAGTKYVSIACTSNDQFYMFVDDITVTATEPAPAPTPGGIVEVTIGDPTSTTTNSYLPGYTLYDYAISQQIYTADEIGVAGTINTLTVWLKNSSSYARNINVYMKEVEATEFASNTAWESFAAADMVVSFTMPNQNTDPIEVALPLDNPFVYSGTGNLAICFQDVTGQWSSGLGGVEMDAAGNQAIYAYRDGTVYDPSNVGVNGTLLAKKNVIRLAIETSTPEPPTEGVSFDPNPLALGYRPTNGWMEPMTMRIHNGLETSVTMTGNMSNTAGVNAFVMSEEIDNVVLESGEDFSVEIDINRNAAAGDYAEQFTLFYIENDRDITLVPVTATFYEAGPADIVETAKTINPTSFDETPTDIHPNYFGSEGAFANDAVYQFTLDKDALFSVNAGTGSFIGIYNKVLDFHPTYSVEPVAYAMGEMVNEILVAGEYYMIVAGENLNTISGSATELPAPSPLTAVSPENGATEVEAPVTLTWTGGENAAEYQVLFGTSPTSMEIALDWTVVDENYGSYTINNLDNNTQYFWQIKARNSNGTVQTTRFGFTTSLTKPHTVTASAEEIFTDESTLIKWKHSSGTMGDLDEIQIGSGTATNNYFPTYNLYNYSLTEQIYTSEELGGTAGFINSISFYPVGAITRNLKVYLANTDKASFTGESDWVAMTAENLVYEGDVAMVANTWVTIQFAEPFEYEGGNIILAVTDHTGTWTSSIYYYTFDATAQAINVYQDTAPYSALAPSGTGTVRNYKNQIIINKSDAKGATANRTFQYYNVYYGDVKANDDPIYEKQYLLSNLPYKMDEGGHAVTVTAVYEEGESTLSAPVYVKVSGYGTFTGTVTYDLTNDPIAGVNVKFVGKDEFENNVAFEGTTDANGVYTINNVKAGNYIGTATIEGMEPKNSDPVTLAYLGTEQVDFVMHEVYKPVLSVVAEEMDPELARVRWSLDVNIPVPGGNTPGGGSASSFTEGFESGMPEGWTVVDANNDGYTWCLTSAIPSTWTYYASMSLDWYRSGTNAICSGSYINGVGALNPDEYLVMGQQNLVNGSTLSFWAAATDASYAADHFGVFVSDDAANWTSVQEWTLTGKGGANNGGRESRDGNGAKIGTWYNYSVDLSAYAGQKYIAIRHFNSYDQYIMCVDDIELSTAKGNRDVAVYNVYRAPILTEDGGPMNVDDIENLTSYYIGSVAGPDTLYADFDWANMEPGLYQYGVSAIYPSPAKGGNRDEIVIGDPTSTTTSSYLPVYSLYEYSLTQQIYTADEIGMAGTINTLTMWLKNNSSYARNINVYMKEADVVTFADGNAWVSMEDSDMVASFTLANGISSPVETAIALNTPFNYSGNGNLVICFQDVTGSWSSGAASVVMTGNGNQAIYAYRDGTVYNPTTPGVTGYVTTNKSVIMLDITPGGGGGNDNPVTPVTWSNVLPKDIETTVVLNAQVPDATAEGVTVRFDNTFENTTFVYTLDETGTDTITDFRKGEYVVTFYLEGYTSNVNEMAISIWEDTEITAVFEEIFEPVTTVTASRSGYVTWDAIVPVDRVAESYIVRLDGAEYAQTTDNFIQLDQDDLVVDQTYTVGVAVLYTSGISPTVNAQFTYADCSAAQHQVTDLTASSVQGNTNVTLAWNGATPTPPTPPTPPTGGWTEGFEGGLNGWTVLTVLSDGGQWIHSNNNLGGYDYTTLAHGGTGFAMCYSFVDYVGAFNTDSYLITPQMNSVSAGSTLTFWADNANDSYPENFSVCVSTAANPTASDFVTVWSGGAKGTGSDGAMVRHSNNRYENWRQHTIDLSAYAGQNVWIAFHDVNNDMYEIWIDDVEFTTAAKLGGNLAAAGVGFGVANNALTDDGNWYYYDNGSNEDAIGTGGGNFWWAIMLPAGSYEGNRLTKVAAYDYMAMTGTASIYQGGTSAPAGTALGTVNVTLTGSSNFVEFEFAEPVEIDPDQNVWVVFYNGSGATYPAAVCANTGDANGRWVSLDGSTWEDMATYSLNYTFMLRAYIESGSGPAPTALQPNKYNIFVDGELVGATASNTFTYDATDFAEHEYVVIWVDSDYLESCVVEGQNQIYYAVQPLGVAENMINTTIYPNPTDGDIRINANNMVRISIVNTLGQVVYDKAVEGNEAIINMAQFGNGVYMVNIATENGTSVKRVVVSK